MTDKQTIMGIKVMRDAGELAAFVSVLDRAHTALRTVDCNLYLDGPLAEEATHGTALRVTDAINAIEVFARERGIALTEFKQWRGK